MSSSNEGEVCWFKCRGYPVWPGLSVSEAKLPRHIKKIANYKKVPFIYYGSKPLEWGFAPSNDIFEFESHKEKYTKQSKQCPNKYKEQLAKAITEAEIESMKSKEERFAIIPIDENYQSSSDDVGDDHSGQDDEDDESEVKSSTDSSNDQVDMALGNILGAKTIISPSGHSDDEDNTYQDDEINTNEYKKRKLNEVVSRPKSKLHRDTLDTQNKQAIKKRKKINSEKNMESKHKSSSDSFSDIIRLKSTNIPVWQQLQQQKRLSNLNEASLFHNKVDDSKIKRLTSFIKLLEQYKVNENMNAVKSLNIINDLEKDTYTYDELRLSKAAEFITNLRQSSNPNIATAANKLRNIWKVRFLVVPLSKL